MLFVLRKSNWMSSLKVVTQAHEKDKKKKTQKRCDEIKVLLKTRCAKYPKSISK